MSTRAGGHPVQVCHVWGAQLQCAGSGCVEFPLEVHSWEGLARPRGLVSQLHRLPCRWGTADLCRHYAFLLADTVSAHTVMPLGGPSLSVFLGAIPPPWPLPPSTDANLSGSPGHSVHGCRAQGKACACTSELQPHHPSSLACLLQSNFIQTFAPVDSDHLRLWSALSLHHFSAEQQKQVGTVESRL